MARRLTYSLLLLASAGFVGCTEEKIRVYTVPKTVAEAAPEQHHEHDGHDHSKDAHGSDPHAGGAQETPSSTPKIGYSVPVGWEDMGSNQISPANFRIKSSKGDAGVNITPLPGMAGQESMIVNMWREQVGQSPLSAEDVSAAFSSVDVAGTKGQLFEVIGTKNGRTLRIISAFVHEKEMSWFYKLQGDDAAVAEQKPVFLDFIKTVRITEGTAAAPKVAKEETPEASEQPQWKVPAQWKQLTAGQMQLAKYEVPSVGDAKAEVSVSAFPNDTGGTLENVKRWRRQLDLGDADEAALKAAVSDLDAALPGAVLVDLKNEKKHLLGAIVPRSGRWWFYKMMGDAAAVSAERDNLIAFAKSNP